MSEALSNGSEKDHGTQRLESPSPNMLVKVHSSSNRTMKRLFWIPIVCGTFLLPSSAWGQLYIGLGIRIGPPVPRQEVIVVRPHRNWVWTPGYYRWAPRRQHYVWIRGRWVRPPYAHAVWIAPRWEQRNGEWVQHEGQWEHETRDSGVTRRR